MRPSAKRELNTDAEIVAVLEDEFPNYSICGPPLFLFASALFNRMTVEAISDLDLSYTHPLGSPWDVVQMACQAWSNYNVRSV